MRKTLVAAVVVTAAVHASADTFSVNSAASPLTITATANTAAGQRSDTENTAASGALAIDLGLPAYPFKTVHITGANVALTSTLSFTFDYSFLGTVNATGTGLAFAMPGPQNKGSAGPTAMIDLAGAFNQAGNKLEPAGTISYSGTGVAGAAVGSGTMNLADSDATDATFAGTLTQTGSTLSLSMPFDTTQSFAVGGGTVDVVSSGTLSATSSTSATGWRFDAAGNWATAANWSNAVPATTAVLGPVISAPRTITNVGDVSSSLIIDSSVPYTLSSAATPQIRKLDVRSGTHVLDTDAEVETFAFSSDARLDLLDSKLTEINTDAAQAELPALIASGAVGNAGIFSSLATSSKRIGYAPVSGLTAMAATLTFAGDADLSGGVNFNDLLTLAKNYNTSGKFWYQGDFD